MVSAVLVVEVDVVGEAFVVGVGFVGLAVGEAVLGGAVFVAQAGGMHLTIGAQITMMLSLMVTSKGVAGVPRASLVVIASTLSFFHIPEGGLLLILAVDHFLDMGRSATSVIGNAVAASVVAKWEGVLGDRPIHALDAVPEA